MLMPHFLPRQHGTIYCGIWVFRILLRKIFIQDSFLRGHLVYPFFQAFLNKNGSGSTMDQQRSWNLTDTIIALWRIAFKWIALSMTSSVYIEVRLKKILAKHSDKSNRNWLSWLVLIISNVSLFLTKKKNRRYFYSFKDLDNIFNFFFFCFLSSFASLLICVSGSLSHTTHHKYFLE